MGLNINL